MAHPQYDQQPQVVSGDSDPVAVVQPSTYSHEPVSHEPVSHEPVSQQPGIQVSVAIVEQDAPTRDRLVGLLSAGVTPFNSLEELCARLTGTVPVVVVLGPSCANEVTLEIAERVMAQYPILEMVLMVEELSTATLQQALRAGVRDVLAISGDSAALPHAVQRLAVLLDQMQRQTQVDATAVAAEAATAADPAEVGTPPIAPVGTHPLAAQSEAAPGQVLTVFSTKGGSGKSVIATALATALAQRSDRPVCLVDADLQFGDVAIMLKLIPTHTIVDAVAAFDRLDAPLLDSLLVTHEESGLKVLPAPLEPAFADQVGATEMVAIIELLRSFCSFVVVDTPSYFNDVVLGLVEASDKVLLVSGLDIPNVKNVKIGLQTLRLLNTPKEKLLLIMNRANSKVKLDVGEVERALQMKADVLVPSEVVVPQSVNKGQPVVIYAPKSSVSKAIYSLAELFLPQEAHKKRFLSRSE
ncbi:MAG: P-loop NTPase [Microthrixaceae bacterium]